MAWKNKFELLEMWLSIRESEATINMDSYLITPSARKKSSIKKRLCHKHEKASFNAEFANTLNGRELKTHNMILLTVHYQRRQIKWMSSLTAWCSEEFDSEWNGLAYWAPTSRVIHQHLIYIIFAGKGSNVLLTGYFFWSARVLSEVRERRSVWESGATVPLTVMHCCAQGVTYL